MATASGAPIRRIANRDRNVMRAEIEATTPSIVPQKHRGGQMSVGRGDCIVDLSFDATETDVDAGGAPLPGTTIIPGTSYGQSPSVGTSTKYMREDATAGTPPSPLTFMPRIVFSGGRADTVFDGKVHVLVRCGGA